MKNKKGFTLLEVLLSVIILSMFIGTIIMIYLNIRGADGKMRNKRVLTAEASDLIDVIHETAIDYTIDYEEYFNRSMMGILPNETGFTSYGNSGTWYYCGDNFSENYNKYKLYKRDNSLGGCSQSGINQKYLEYQFQHRKLKTGNLNSKENSGSNIGMGPIAIYPNTGLDYLYLINGDGTERYYFRRIFVTGIDLNHDGTTGINEKLYKIQMLKLKGYDAGSGHDFNSRGAYDGFIDTRACDKSQGFNCTGLEVQEGSRLPIDENDGWIDVTTNRVTVRDMKIDIFPEKDPYLANNEDEYKMDPYAKISFTMNIFGEESNDEITLSTTLGFKNSYRRFPVVEYTGYIAIEE